MRSSIVLTLGLLCALPAIAAPLSGGGDPTQDNGDGVGSNNGNGDGKSAFIPKYIGLGPEVAPQAAQVPDTDEPGPAPHSPYVGPKGETPFHPFIGTAIVDDDKTTV